MPRAPRYPPVMADDVEPAAGAEPAALIETRRYREGAMRHRHAYHQIVLPLAGAMEMEIGGRAARLDDGCLAAIAAGEAHEFEAGEEGTFLVFDIPGAAGAADALGSAPFRRIDGALGGVCHALARIFAGREPGRDEAQLGGAVLLGALTGAPGRVPPPRIARAMEIMRANLALPLSLPAVAREAGISERRLHAGFQAHLGTTPGRWLAEQRLGRARELLAQTSLPVSQIAADVGYSDPAAFARAYRRAFGEAPRRGRS